MLFRLHPRLLNIPLGALVVLLGTFVAIGLMVAASGVTRAAGIRMQDEIVEINTRPCDCTTDSVRLAHSMRVKEWVPTGNGSSRRWVNSEFHRLQTLPDSDRVTVVYVHGNKIDHCDTRRRSLDVYRELVAQADDDRPIRFVIWSWPASEVSGLLRDCRVKAARTRPVGWQLAWSLNQFPAGSRVSLLGYSYGAQVVCGATHLLAGGELSGLSLEAAAEPCRQPVRVALVAAAMHADWLGPGHCHGRAMAHIDRLVVTRNAKDPAMQFYKFAIRNGSPQAMGLKGPLGLDSESRARLTCIDTSRCVGRSHDLYKYMACQRTMSCLWNHLTYADELAVAP